MNLSDFSIYNFPAYLVNFINFITNIVSKNPEMTIVFFILLSAGSIRRRQGRSLTPVVSAGVGVLIIIWVAHTGNPDNTQNRGMDHTLNVIKNSAIATKDKVVNFFN